MTRIEARNLDFEVCVRELAIYACTAGRQVKCATGMGTFMTLADTPDDPAFRRG